MSDERLHYGRWAGGLVRRRHESGDGGDGPGLGSPACGRGTVWIAAGHPASIVTGALFFAALAAVLALAHTGGWVACRLGQPAVVGEIAVGVAAGPTLFGGNLMERVLGAQAESSLFGLGNLGLALLMLQVGAHVGSARLRGRRRAVVVVSLGSVTLPFALGVALAVFLAPHHTTMSRVGFVLFLGAAMSVTALPVLARILVDHRMDHTLVGVLALACAAVGDVVGWALLAFAAVASSAASSAVGEWQVVAALAYLAMALVARPVLRRLPVDAVRGVRGGVPAAVAVGLCLSCYAAETVGLHFVFGAFLFGAVLPDGLRQRAADTGLDHANRLLLLPVFFICAGLRVDLSGVDWARFGELALILLTAVVGKYAGVYNAARLVKLPRHTCGQLAVLMNTRGLTEIAMLTVGLQLEIIDVSLYSLMAVMALVTTAMTGPALGLLGRRSAGRTLSEDTGQAGRDSGSTSDS